MQRLALRDLLLERWVCANVQMFAPAPNASPILLRYEEGYLEGNKMRFTNVCSLLVTIAVLVSTSDARAAWADTGFTEVNIRMDNGVIYFYPAMPNGSLSFPLSGNCLNNRLELNNSGDRFGSVENAKRIMALILGARLAGKRVLLGYDDADGPACRIAQVTVEW